MSEAELTSAEVERDTWLTVQTILYGNAPDAVMRTAQSLARSIELAVHAGLVTRCWWRIGDCSPVAVLDAAHQEALAAVFEPLWGLVEVDFFGENLGHGGGHNRLFPRLDSPVVLIANPDLIFSPGTISALMRRVAPQIGLIDARQIPLEHPKAYDRITGQTGWASGACLLARTDMLAALDGFDADTFFMYCDDVDLSWRARLAGYRVISEPAACVFHDKRLGSDGSIETSDAEHYYSAEAALLLAHKYSRPDVVAKLRADLQSSTEPDHQRAVAVFERREAEGLLAQPLDPEHAVGEFVDGAYTSHRF